MYVGLTSHSPAAAHARQSWTLTLGSSTQPGTAKAADSEVASTAVTAVMSTVSAVDTIAAAILVSTCAAAAAFAFATVACVFLLGTEFTQAATSAAARARSRKKPAMPSGHHRRSLLRRLDLERGRSSFGASSSSLVFLTGAAPLLRMASCKLAFAPKLCVWVTVCSVNTD